MNCILLEQADFCAPTQVRLDGRRLEHVRSVHRAQAGDTLRVGVIGGALGIGTVNAVDEHHLAMTVEFTGSPPAPLPCVLVVALPRPKSMRKVLHAATTAGVKRICFVNSHRVDKSYWKSPRMQPDSVRETLILGLEQCVDTILPEVSFHKRLRWFLEDDIPGLCAGRTRLIAHPGSAQPCPHAPGGELALAIGPEGGFMDYEIEYFEKAGFTPVSMGLRILRVEEAVAAMLGKLF